MSSGRSSGASGTDGGESESDADEFGFTEPSTDQSFGNALAKAHDGARLTVDDATELLATGTEREGIDPVRKEAVLEAADRRRAEAVGDEVTFVANLNNNVTTACNTGCLFCNFKDSAHAFEADSGVDHAGFTKPPAESRAVVEDALDMGVYEVCSVSGLHPAFALNDEHHEILAARDDPASEVNYEPPAVYDTDPGTYLEQMDAMSVGGVHLHSMTPEEAYHARRGTDWEYETVYRELAAAGLDSAPGTAAEILVDEVREVICPNKIDTAGWVDAMTAAADVGLDTTATIRPRRFSSTSCGGAGRRDSRGCGRRAPSRTRPPYRSCGLFSTPVETTSRPTLRPSIFRGAPIRPTAALTTTGG